MTKADFHTGCHNVSHNQKHTSLENHTISTFVDQNSFTTNNSPFWDYTNMDDTVFFRTMYQLQALNKLGAGSELSLYY